MYSKDQLNENDINTIMCMMDKHSIKAKVLSKQEEIHNKLQLSIKDLCLNEKEVYLLELIEMIRKRER